MSVAGYMHVERLRGELLPPEISNGSKWEQIEPTLARIGQGVAGAFDLFCGRTFRHGAVKVIRFQADGRDLFCLHSAPVQAVDDVQLVPLGGSAIDYVEDSDFWLDPATGMIRFSEDCRPTGGQLTVTFEGGYYVDLTQGGDGAVPAGQEALPDALLDAFLHQCALHVEALNLLGTRTLSIDQRRPNIDVNTDALTPYVLGILEQFRVIAV